MSFNEEYFLKSFLPTEPFPELLPQLKMIVNDSENDAGILYHTLHKQKTKRSSQPHSLKHSVSNNVAHTKKH